jgi:hypothetical protein
MRTLLVYKERSDHARDVETFLRDFTRQTGSSIEAVNPETPEGAQFCQTYDIVEYPTLVALDDSGQVQNLWRGLPFPTISEVSYYVSQS